MKTLAQLLFLWLFVFGACYGAESRLQISYAAIMPPKEFLCGGNKCKGNLEKLPSLEALPLKFSSIIQEEVNYILEDLADKMFDVIVDTGPNVASKMKKNVAFNDLIEHNEPLTPALHKELYYFHSKFKRDGVRYLSELLSRKENKADFLFTLKTDQRKWSRFGKGLYKRGDIEEIGAGVFKVTVVVFAAETKARTFKYAKLEARDIIEENYELITSIIEKPIKEAFQAAIQVGSIRGMGVVASTPDQSPDKIIDRKLPINKKTSIGDLF